MIDDDDTPPLYSEAQIQVRATRYLRAGRAIDAGWTTSMLSAAPRDVNKDDLHLTRTAFFTGASYMLDMMTAVARTPNSDKKIEYSKRFLRELLAEIKQFRDAEGSPPEPPLEPQKQAKRTG
jgi:hypothetical protein